MISKFRESLSIAIVGIVMIGIFSIGLFFVIKNEPTPKTEQTVTQTETTQPEEPKPRVWRGSDYGLPAGVVVGGEYLESSPSSNWVSIQQADGHIVIVKNLEWQLYGAIEEGDIIE